uniref:Uncharacterized protein n=1 Tax=Eutreptiella gymnastica TaxID=73025 RepID=A0A7S1N9M4_9EUGL
MPQDDFKLYFVSEPTFSHHRRPCSEVPFHLGIQFCISYVALDLDVPVIHELVDEEKQIPFLLKSLGTAQRNASVLLYMWDVAAAQISVHSGRLQFFRVLVSLLMIRLCPYFWTEILFSLLTIMLDAED